MIIFARKQEKDEIPYPYFLKGFKGLKSSIGVSKMIPYKKEKINSLIDVKEEYPKLFDTDHLKDEHVKTFAKEELESMITEAIDKYEFEKEIGLKPIKYSRLQLSNTFLATATARGLYRYYWCHFNTLDQIWKYGYKTKDLEPLMKRMKRAHYDPWSTTENTAGQFIESLKNYGCKRIKTKDGDEYFVHNAKGYGEDDSEDIRNDRDDKYYF